MMFYAVAVQLAILTVVSASVVSVKPTVRSQSTHTSGPYTYRTYYSHHKEYVYTYESCSTPPASIEICLSSLVTSMENDLGVVNMALGKHVGTLKQAMAAEKTMLVTEITLVSEVSAMADSIRENIISEYEDLNEQINDLKSEKVNIEKAYAEVESQMEALVKEIGEINSQRDALDARFKSIEAAKWTVAKAVSEINNQKARVQKEEADISSVVSVLYSQAEKIEEKLSQLRKRQIWLSVWESKMYSGIVEFREDIQEFKADQKEIYAQENKLSIEQKSLLAKVEAAKQAIAALKAEYASVNSKLEILEGYEKSVFEIGKSMAQEGSAFLSAYDDFTCEESLLEYEACNKPAAATKATAKVASKSAPPKVVS